MSETPVTILRDIQARTAAIRALTLRYEEHAIAEQLATDEADDEVRLAHHDAVVLTIRALNAEMDDPEPAGLP